jgi:preprotein translocase subunit YajC
VSTWLDILSLPMTLAQDGGGIPGVPGTGGGESGQPGGGQGPHGGGIFDMLLPLMLVVLFMFIMMSVLGGRKERRRRQEMLGQVGKNDRVQTVGGVIGTVVEVKGDELVLKVDESSNTRICFARSAVQQILHKSGAQAAGAAG